MAAVSRTAAAMVPFDDDLDQDVADDLLSDVDGDDPDGWQDMLDGKVAFPDED